MGAQARGEDHTERWEARARGGDNNDLPLGLTSYGSHHLLNIATQGTKLPTHGLLSDRPYSNRRSAACKMERALWDLPLLLGCSSSSGTLEEVCRHLSPRASGTSLTWQILIFSLPALCHTCTLSRHLVSLLLFSSRSSQYELIIVVDHQDVPWNP
jgi:hypothetical protein